MKTFARFFLIRHGETAANIEMRYIGSRDDPLTDRGQWQAEQLARILRQLPITVMYTSPLQRAGATAAQIGQQCGLVVHRDDRLREGSFGDWEGLSRPEVLTRSQYDVQRLKQWESDSQCAPPGGESLYDVQVRVRGLVDELAVTHAGEWVVLVSHVGPIKALLCATLGVPLSAGRHLFLDPATISVVDWSGQPIVRLFNAHSHLGWTAARWMSQGSPTKQ